MRTKFLIAVASWLSTCTVTLGSPGLTLTGNVTDSAGKPISHATVMVYHAGVKHGYSTFCPSCYKDCGKRTTTDGKGSYTITKLDPELWFQLLIVRGGYSPTFVKVLDPSNGAPTGVLNLRTRVTDPSREVKGRVIDAAGNPVPNAVVTALGIETDEGATEGEIPGLDPLAVTDGQGYFELVYSNSAKRMLVSVEARMLAPKFAVLTTDSDRQTIPLSRGATIRGRLVEGGKPVGNAEIGLIAQERGGFGPHLKIIGNPYLEVRVGTREDGSFVISDMPNPVKWYVYAKMESVSRRGATEAKACATTRPEEIVEVGDLQLQHGYRFKGRVLLTDRKSVPQGMRVLIFSEEVGDTQTAILDKDGRFEFLSLPRGKYSVSPAVRGYSLPDAQYDVQVSVERDEDDFVISLRPSPKLP